MGDEIYQDYLAVGFHGQLGFGERPVLLLVDFIQAYFERSCPLYAAVEETLSSALRVLDMARSAGIPIAFTTARLRSADASSNLMARKTPMLDYFDEGSSLSDWAPGLSPLDGELIITKQYPSAFFGTTLASSLTTLGVDSVIITGLTTSGCVRATCVDALCHGFIPIVVRDAVGDRHPDPHEANLFDMGAKYADVVREDEVLQYLGAYQRSEKGDSIV